MRSRAIIFWIATPLLLIALAYWSLNIGLYHLSHSFFSLIGVNSATQSGSATLNSKNLDASVLWQVRWPRTLGALLIGGAIGIAGALTQALFRNPLAEPSLIGISSGATFGSTLAIGAGLGAFGSLAHIGLAITFALLSGALIIFIAPKGTYSFLLTGIALSAVVLAIAGLSIEISQKPGAQSITFWNFGSLAALNFSEVKNIFPFLLVGAVGALCLAKYIDLYTLGDETAFLFGLSVKPVRYLILLLAVFLVGSSVAIVGSIAFLGLIAPHIARLIVGPKHRKLLPASALLGSLILVIADLAARTVVSPLETPVGLFTSLIGAPVLIFLLRWLDWRSAGEKIK